RRFAAVSHAGDDLAGRRSDPAQIDLLAPACREVGLRGGAHREGGHQRAGERDRPLCRHCGSTTLWTTAITSFAFAKPCTFFQSRSPSQAWISAIRLLSRGQMLVQVVKNVSITTDRPWMRSL